MPRIALISDIHGNIEALEAVLADIRAQRIDEIFCLGDIVGYGAAPAECLRLVREHCTETILGNHDEYLVNGPENHVLSKRIGIPLLLAQQTIPKKDLQWLRDRPYTVDRHGFSIVHGSLHHPEVFCYLLERRDAVLHFEEQRTPLCFHGHSHRPLITLSQQDGDIRWSIPRETETLLDRNQRLAINVGSVGQPRDQDPRAAYGIYDMEQNSFTLRRITYDIEKAVQRIVDAGIPEENSRRLREGE
jgi:predicted phosphodiesterase